MCKKQYSRPELVIVELRLCDVICNSLEGSASQVNAGDFGPNPYVDPIEDEIIE